MEKGDQVGQRLFRQVGEIYREMGLALEKGEELQNKINQHLNRLHGVNFQLSEALGNYLGKKGGHHGQPGS